MKSAYVYILTNRKNGTFYTGVSNNLERRIWEHRNNPSIGFSKRYGTYRLVYAEEHSSIDEAIYRKKCIKRWKRSWKIRLSEAMNPNWDDLSKYGW